MSFEFVRLDVLKNIHGWLIERYGGLPGVRDENALGSAVERPKTLEYYAGETSVPVLGAALAWAILRNHPFSDGNKRTALAGLTVFLELNGYRLNCSEVEETAMILRAAASELTEDEFTGWVMNASGAVDESL